MEKWNHKKHKAEWEEYKEKHAHDQRGYKTYKEFYAELYQKFRNEIMGRERAKETRERRKQLAERFAKYR